jgi:hypothetical protein
MTAVSSAGRHNPYGERRSILQLEKVNFPPGKDGDLATLDPPLCFAISAKRYVLFNRKDGQPIIRKASGHGLGHLLEPYDELPKERRERIKRIGVPLWHSLAGGPMEGGHARRRQRNA